MIQMEIGFNILYLLGIYLLVFLMFRKHRSELYISKPGAEIFLLAFLLLAIGDTGHVGFRLIAYANGGLENNQVLVGLGALATAITITVFYVLLIEVWRRKTNAPKNWIFWSVLFLGIARLIIMTVKGNQWGQVVPPYDFSLMRNAFLTLMGIVVLIVYLITGMRNKDCYFGRMAIAIFFSFAFYIPVILFVQKVPMIGMLMIPKTIAYVYMAIVGYQFLFKKNTEGEQC